MQAVGPLALLCVLFFLCSSFLLGRLLFPGEGALDDLLALLLGIGIWMLLIGSAAHFPVNTPLTYLVTLSIPFVIGRRLIRPGLGAVLSWFRPQPISLSSYIALLLLLFVVLIHYLAALKPEVSHDRPCDAHGDRIAAGHTLGVVVRRSGVRLGGNAYGGRLGLLRSCICWAANTRPTC